MDAFEHEVGVRVYHYEDRIAELEAALKAALEDVWAVESHAAKGTSLDASRDARIIEKGMLRLARHRLEAVIGRQANV